MDCYKTLPGGKPKPELQGMHILIAEKYSHVAEFVRREMEAEGHAVDLALTGQELIRKIGLREPVDMVILDPDMPDIDMPETLRLLRCKFPRATIVLHTFETDYEVYGKIIGDAVFVEKKGNSIEGLKRVVDARRRKIKPPG